MAQEEAETGGAGGPCTRLAAPRTEPPLVLLVNHVAQMSGAEASLLGLARRLPSHHFAVEVAAPAGGPLAEALAAAGVRLHPVALARIRRREPPWRRLGSAVRLGMSARVLAGLARQRRAALIHANSTTAALAGLLAARWIGVPGIWHVRDLVSLAGIGHRLGRWAARVIAISGAVADAVARAGVPSDRIHVVPNGIDPEAFVPDPEQAARMRAALGIPPGAFVVAAVGQIVPWKGHHVLLDALGRIRRRDPDVPVHCVIAGADLWGDHADYEALLRARAGAPDLVGSVRFLGYRRDVAAVYQACDVFVLPSRQEPFGRALIEAMACGKPVIACQEGGPAEIVTDGETGVLVPPGDAEAMAAAIERVRQNPDLAGRLGEAGRQRVLAAYTEAHTAARMAEVYREVLQARPAGE